MVHLAARKFGRDDRGATSVEFAIVSIPFLGLLFAIFQTGLAFFMQQTLEAAVENASRQILTGQVQNNSSITTWQNFRDQLICPPAPAVSFLPDFMTCSNLVVDVRTAASFSSTTASSTSDSFLFDGSGTQYNPGCPNQIVIVRAAYPMPVYLPLLTSNGVGASSSVNQNTTGLTTYNGALVQMLTAASVYRNEPFTPKPAGCP